MDLRIRCSTRTGADVERNQVRTSTVLVPRLCVRLILIPVPFVYNAVQVRVQILRTE